LAEIEDIKLQLAATVEAAKREAERFELLCQGITPLLQEHPDWCWGEAAEYLRNKGVKTPAQVRADTAVRPHARPSR
jgi:hypothetical protein